MWNDTPVTRRLGLRYPIIQGPFGGGASTVPLAAAVSNAGGLGSFGAHLLSPTQITDLTTELRRATTGPFALNLWVSNQDEGGDSLSPAAYAASLAVFQPYYDKLGITIPPRYEPDPWNFEAQVAAVLEARPAVFSFVFGIPRPEILAECRRRNIVTIGAATTVDEAIANEQAGVDIVLATGCEAGGHRPSFLRPAEESLLGTLALVPQIVEQVKIPVIAAGGIANARGAAAAFALGAHAVQLGTAFLACEESGISESHRRQLFSPVAKHTKLSRSFTGRLARFIPNELLNDLEARQKNALPYPLQSWFTGFIKQAAAAQARSDYLSLYAGQGAPLIRHRRAADLMTALVSELEQTFRSASGAPHHPTTK